MRFSGNRVSKTDSDFFSEVFDQGVYQHFSGLPPAAILIARRPFREGAGLIK